MNVTINDKDTWDVTFPEPSADDIVLWCSDKYSEDQDEDTMIAQFLADIKSGYVDVPESTVMTEDNKKLLIDKYFTDWYCDWIDKHRWNVMDNDLEFIEDCFYTSKEYLPSSHVLCIKRGWSAEGDGHSYGIFKAYSVNDVIVFIRDNLLPREVPEEDEYTILLPKDGTLALEYLTSPFYSSDGSVVTDDSGAEIYEGGTIMEFYHIKPSKVGLFKTLRDKDKDSKNADMPMTVFNKFCEGQIEKHGKSKFIETYLDKISNVVEHVWLGTSLDPQWDVDAVKNTKRK